MYGHNKCMNNKKLYICRFRKVNKVGGDCTVMLKEDLEVALLGGKR